MITLYPFLQVQIEIWRMITKDSKIRSFVQRAGMSLLLRGCDNNKNEHKQNSNKVAHKSAVKVSITFDVLNRC